MKKYIFLLLLIVSVLSLTGCGRKESFDIEILVPAGSTADFVYSEAEIRPTGNKITISSGAGLGDTEVILKPVKEHVETGYVAEYLTHGASVKFDTASVKDEWFQIGVSVQNDSDRGPIAVCVEVEGVEVRIAEEADSTGTEQEETILYNGKEYLKSELCDATLQWLELSEEERLFSSYLPPEFMIFEETWGVTLTTENVTPRSATLKCTQSEGEPTGELQTGSWYILETWTQETGWTEARRLKSNDTVAWTEEAWTVPMEDTCEWEINWEWLYGELPEGKYRIGKEMMDFRGTGDYDTAIYYAEFVI